MSSWHVTGATWFWLFGVGSGIAFVLSCGDNLSVKTDADVVIDTAKAPDAAPICDCPVVEPPLAGRWIVVSQTRMIDPNGYSLNATTCPMGSQIVFGSCTMDQLNPIRNVTLEQAGFFGFSPRDWACFFHNNENTPVTFRTSAICLVLAS
jgi:hypothetical protein